MLEEQLRFSKTQNAQLIEQKRKTGRADRPDGFSDRDIDRVRSLTRVGFTIQGRFPGTGIGY